MKRLRGQKGFTLIELMIVVAIIGILAAIAVATLQNLIITARVGSEDGVISALNSAAVITFGKLGVLPSTAQVSAEVRPALSNVDSLTGQANVGHTSVTYCTTGVYWTAATDATNHPTGHIHPTTCS